MKARHNFLTKSLAFAGIQAIASGAASAHSLTLPFFKGAAGRPLHGIFEGKRLRACPSGRLAGCSRTRFSPKPCVQNLCSR